MSVLDREPLDNATMCQLVRTIVKTGSVAFSPHARKELAKDDFTTADALNMLLGGRPRADECGHLRDGTYRYRLHTARMCVVVAFRSETELVVVTAWRKNRQP